MLLVTHFSFPWPSFQVPTSHREPIDTGSLGRYAIMGTLIYPNVLYIWYLSVRISYHNSNPYKMDQFSQKNKHTTLILELRCSYGHSAMVILYFVSDDKPLCKMSSGSVMTRKSKQVSSRLPL
jgi:hypothetical protein